MGKISTEGKVLITESRRSTLLCILILLLVIILFYFKQIIGITHIPYDSKDQVYPFIYFVREAYLSGHFPFWNPYIYSGTPAFADPLYMAFYPGTFLYLIPKTLSMTFFDVVEFFHIFIGGVAFFFLAKCYLKNNLGSLICGIVFMLGGPMVGRVQTVVETIAISLSPVVLLLLKKYVMHRKNIFLVFATLFLGMILMIGYQPAILFSITAILFLFTEIIKHDRSRNRWKKAFVICVIVSILALGISAIQVIPTIELARNSNRPAFSYDQAVAGSIRVQNFLTIFFPNLYNTLDGNYWGPADITEGYLYVGFLPVFLAAVGFISAIKKRDYLVPIVFLSGLLYAIGRYTPFYKIITTIIFPLRLFQRPSDGLFIAHIFFCFLLLFGLKTLESQPFPRTKISPVLLGSFLVYVFCFIAANFILHRYSKDLNLSSWFFWGSCIGLLIVPLILNYRLPTNLVFILFTLAILLDLTLVSKDRLFNTGNVEISSTSVLGCSDIVDTLNNPENDLYRYETIGLGGILRNSAIIWKLPSTQGYSPLMVGKYAELTEINSYGWNQHHSKYIPSYASTWFNLLAVKNIIYYPNEDGKELLNDINQNYFINKSNCLPMAVNTKALPIIYLVNRYVVVGNNDQIAEIMNKTSPDNLVILTKKPDVPSNMELQIDENYIGQKISGKVEIIERSINRIQVQTINSEPSFLVYSDTDYPGWKVRVDGKEATLLRTNLAYKGVYLSEGTHIVEFEFLPDSFLWGGGITLLTILVMLIMLTKPHKNIRLL